MELLLENTLYSNQQGNMLVVTVLLAYPSTLIFFSFLIPFLHHRCFFGVTETPVDIEDTVLGFNNKTKDCNIPKNMHYKVKW